MPLIALVNPACGDRTAEQFVKANVLPLLEKSKKSIDKLVLTEDSEHAGKAVVQFMEETEGPVSILIASGDGTLHEVVNTLSTVELKGTRATAPPSKISLVLIPCGTANALYSSLFPPTSHPEAATDPTAYKLKSVEAYIAGNATKPLTLAISSISSPPSSKSSRPRMIVSAVVTSTSLHASILHDSEALRATVPGIERFKTAAMQNITRWYPAELRLLPAPAAGVVEIYDPETGKFVAHEESDEDEPVVELAGPFSYFLSTVNVDRLEPAFRITPLHQSIPPSLGTMEVVVVRPLNDPSISFESEEARQGFAQKVGTVLQAAYQDGKHVDMRYDKGGSLVESGSGPLVVEYFRVGGWVWVPHQHDDEEDSPALLCADGDILTIEKGGRASCTAASPNNNETGFGVYI